MQYHAARRDDHAGTWQCDESIGELGLECFSFVQSQADHPSVTTRRKRCAMSSSIRHAAEVWSVITAHYNLPSPAHAARDLVCMCDVVRGGSRQIAENAGRLPRCVRYHRIPAPLTWSKMAMNQAQFKSTPW
jgi:hypothetical protein